MRQKGPATERAVLLRHLAAGATATPGRDHNGDDPHH
jgi:hypothetical protein